jgi:hypothetical protein
MSLHSRRGGFKILRQILSSLLSGTAVIPTGVQRTSLCLALEDSHHGVRSASSAGMMTIMMPDLLPATDELRTLCLHVVPDLYEVHRVLVASRQAA